MTIELSKQDSHDGNMHVDLTQDDDKTEKARDESQRNWAMMLEGIKKVVEQA